MTHFGCEKSVTMRLLSQNNIGYSKQIALPREEMRVDEEVLNNLFMAAQYLNDLANTKGLRVLLQSTAGITRTSTVYLIYLALYKAHPDYSDPTKLLTYLRQYVPFCTPNSKLIQKMLKTKKDFQDR